MFLITTALEKSWQYNSGEVLFLGEWCRRYSRREKWQTINSKVLPYHWDDRTKLRADYRYIQNINDRILKDLADKLNTFHGTDYSFRYWKILIGPWLGCFLQILYDRWFMIQKSVSEGASNTIIINDCETAPPPQDMLAFMVAMMQDCWNHGLCSQIIRGSTNIKISTVEDKNIFRNNFPIPITSPGLKRAVLKNIINFGSKILGTFSRSNDFFLISTYLPVLDEFRLGLKLRQAPQIWRSIAPPKTRYHCQTRDWILGGSSPYDAFEAIARTLIPLQIPTLYLEGYKELQKCGLTTQWPKRPRLIFSSNAEITDDVYKVWLAEKVEKGIPLVVGQHGGHFGIGEWNYLEDHLLSICDYYLSWGWKGPCKKILPIGQLKSKYPLGVKHSQNINAMLVTVVHPPMSYWLYSSPVAGQWLGYINDNFTFVENLPIHIQEILIVRLYKQDFGWDQKARWRDRLPQVKLDVSGCKIEKIIKHCRIVISTYNATVFLETLTMNVPTIVFWNPEHWELRDSAKNDFIDLEQVRIFHSSPRSAAVQVAEIWDNVDLWWSSPEVQNARSRFLEKYSRMPVNLLDQVASVLNNAADKCSKL